MAKKLLQKEVDDWLESDVETALIELKTANDENLDFCIGENEQLFSILFPKEYPKSKEKFIFFSEDGTLTSWVHQMNEFIDKKGASLKLETLLTEAAEKYLELHGDEDEDEEFDDEEDMLGLETVDKSVSKPKKSKEEEEIDNKEFLEIGSASATMRLIKDLKTINKTNPKDLGFSAAPKIETRSGLENLYHWDVKLFNFDKDSELSKDMDKYKKISGQDFILLELRFSKDYPFAPPFVRVVRPRFAFRTGHVTLGGSICMELLTNSGWNSIKAHHNFHKIANDIESILIQIRAELLSGGARLDPGMSNAYEYSEQEAWEAFYRAARTHGWNVDGLNKDMFPKIPQ